MMSFGNNCYLDLEAKLNRKLSSFYSNILLILNYKIYEEIFILNDECSHCSFSFG
jgi:hypothetical protein